MDSESSSLKCTCEKCLLNSDSESDSDKDPESDSDYNELSKCNSFYEKYNYLINEYYSLINEYYSNISLTNLSKSLLETKEFKIIKRMIYAIVKAIVKTDLDKGVDIIFNLLENNSS